jgi:putative redox protein
MATVKEKTVVTPKMEATCVTHARTDLSTRDVSIHIDEPIARGGTNMGFTPTETVVAALVACTNVISSRIAEPMGVDLQNMEIKVDYDFDPRGAQLKQEVNLVFIEIRMAISVNSNGTPEQIEKIRSDLAKFCPIAKLFTQAGGKIVDTWDVSPL